MGQGERARERARERKKTLQKKQKSLVSGSKTVSLTDQGAIQQVHESKINPRIISDTAGASEGKSFHSMFAITHFARQEEDM